MWKILRLREMKLRKTTLKIYKRNIELVNWFLSKKCNLSKEDVHVVMSELMETLRDNIEEIYDKDKKSQSEWILYQAYLIAKRRFEDIPEVYYEHE